MKQFKLGTMMGLLDRDKFVMNQVRKNRSIVYGGQAIKRNIGTAYARSSFDWDILSKQPKKAANQLQRTLDKNSGGDYYYSTASKKHKGTHKVYFKGYDLKRDTDDDIGIADFSKPLRKYRTRTIHGIKFVKLSETLRDKRRALGEKEFEFRHKKDQEDVDRIKAAQRMRRY